MLGESSALRVRLGSETLEMKAVSVEVLETVHVCAL